MAQSPGSVLASFLKGSWRRKPPALVTSGDELTQIAPLLLRSGGGALGWHRVRDSSLQASAVARSLRQAYRLHTIRTAIHECELQTCFGALRSAGVEPILIKGWAVARLYPEAGLRPYGDFDIVVRPEQYAAAVTVLNDVKSGECSVDLHPGLAQMQDQSLDALYARSRIAHLGTADIRVLGAEDHLVVLIRHFLRHNAWRPLWLCDIAAVLESGPTDFDWDRCLSGPRYQTSWVTCTLGLAHALLDAQLDGTPVTARATDLPTWLVPAVLRQWDHCVGPGERAKVVPYIASHWHQPRQIFREARARWDMPIAATVALRGPFTELPRLPFQLGLALFHVPTWCQELRRYLHERWLSRAG
jgi:Uncharacterised nucleotidyltransferase